MVFAGAQWRGSTLQGAVMFKKALIVLLLIITWPTISRAQYVWCPPGTTPVPGGGGNMCLCPDGSYAGIGGCSGSYQPQQPICPAGTGYCAESHQCCNPGFYCSRYGCTPVGAVECGGYYCNPGMACMSGGRCMPAGNTECGNHTCYPGYYCGSRNSCLAEGSNDCGNGASCPAGNKCSRNGQKCLAQDTVDCGSFFCNAGAKCGSGNKCLAMTDVDCGGGRSCRSGTVCVKGGEECLTRGQIAERRATERRKAEEKVRRLKEEKEATEWVKRERERQAREVAQRQREEVAARQREIETRRREAEVAKQREAERARQEAAARQAEAKRVSEQEALKKSQEEQARIEAQNRALQEKIELAKKKIELEKLEAESKRIEQEQLRHTREALKPVAPLDKHLQTILDDPRQSTTVRSIAAIALGKDPARLGLANPNDPSSVPRREPTAAERAIARLAFGNPTGAPKQSPATAGAPNDFDRELRTIMNDPTKPAAQRRIARIALGKDTTSIRNSFAQQNAPAPQPAPSASSTPAGSTQSTAPGLRAPPGTSPPAGGTFPPTEADVIRSSISSVAPAISQPMQSSNLWNALENGVNLNQQANLRSAVSSLTVQVPTVPANTLGSNLGISQVLTTAAKSTVSAGFLLSHFYQSNPGGQILVDTLTTAGGEAAQLKFGTWASGFGAVSEGASIITLWQQKNYGGLASNLTSLAGSSVAASAGADYAIGGISASPVAAGTFALSFDLSSKYIAPKVAPYTGTWLYNLDPSFWTPSPTFQPFNAPISWKPLPSKPFHDNPFDQQPFGP